MEEPNFEEWTLERFEAERAKIRETLQPCIGRPVTINEELWRIDEIYVDGSLKVQCTYYDGRNFIEDKGVIMEFDSELDLIENIRKSIPKVIALNEAEKAELNNEYT